MQFGLKICGCTPERPDKSKVLVIFYEHGLSYESSLRILLDKLYLLVLTLRFKLSQCQGKFTDRVRACVEYFLSAR